ncbi:hypothetical protein CASFOL_019769 [Castilleja foliolosa]|uniref:Uncharacterized protein n=1 Tax=Castilleja foliolosa TaxID=1961234 RepID=A0ABD3D332_9LAMI
MSNRSVGQAEGMRYQMDPLPQHYYSCASSRQSRGNGLVHCDECGHYFDRRMADRNVRLEMSPSVLSCPLRNRGERRTR